MLVSRLQVQRLSSGEEIGIRCLTAAPQMAEQERSPVSALTAFPTIMLRASGKAACANADIRGVSAKITTQ